MSGAGSEKKPRTGFSYNNTVRLLRSGSDFFDALVKLIDDAVHEIHFQTYIFEEDETGERILHALVRAAERGVKIFLLLDAYGSNNLPQNFLATIKNAKIEFRWFGQLFRNGKFHIGRRLHRKVVVADGFSSIVSGINISDRYNDLHGNAAWLDFGVFVQGEVSEKIYLICVQSWLKIRFRKSSAMLKTSVQQSVQPVDHPVKIRVRQNDRKIGKNEAAARYYTLIRHAKESITIVGGYFLPGRKARRLLKKASERGVVIRLIIAERSDVGVMRNAMLYLYDWLLRYRIHIYEYQPSNVHGKAIVADRKMVSIGSYDMNTLSTYSNIEMNLDIDDEKIASGFQDQLDQIIQSDCIEISEEKFKKKRGVIGRLIQWFSYKFVKSLFILSVWVAKKEKDTGNL